MPSQASGRMERGLRLLSIDGGGIRGLSPLLILKEIMYRIQQENHLKELPLPCDVFDLAGGTSTGGLIVIMLFRLKMSINEAIDAYATLARVAFSCKKWFFQDGTFKASRLEDAMISIIQSSLLDADDDPQEAKMLRQNGPKCFVCAMLAENKGFPTLFRSWVPATNRTFDCTIIQAARATTAAPTFFKAIEFGHPTRQRYLDGGLRCNNPVKHVVDEARSLYPDRLISCVLSLGTGATQIIGLERPDAFQNMMPTKLVRVLRGIATDCHEQSEIIAKQLYQRDKPNVYFRLNVNEGLQMVSLAEWSRLDEVEAHTVQYLRTKEVGQKVDQVVELLNAKLPATEMSSTLPAKELSPTESKAFDDLKKATSQNAFRDSHARSGSTGCLPGTRQDEIQMIMNWIEMANEEKPLFVVLGPAGSGKTSLLHTISHICEDKGYHAASFFFSGTDMERNNDARFITSITCQIAEAIPELRPYVARVVESQPSILTGSLASQTKTLLIEPIRLLRSNHPSFSFQPRVIIIDALDECGKLEDQCRVIASLKKLLSAEGFPFSCLLASRFNPHIEYNISTTFLTRISEQVILGRNRDAERADIRAYLRASIDRIRNKHVFGKRIPQDWPLESDLETIANRSHGQFIYASTVVRYVESPEHNPCERLRFILDISGAQSGVHEDPFAELHSLYRALMSSVKNLSAGTDILAIELLRSRSRIWIPAGMERFNYPKHFQSLDADIILAPMASVLKCERGEIKFYHLTFPEFLLDPAQSREYSIIPTKWQKWFVSRVIPRLYKSGAYLSDVEYLIKEAKPGTDLHEAIDEGLALVDSADHPRSSLRILPRGNKFNIWPLVAAKFLDHLHFQISVYRVADVFSRCGKNFLSLAILLPLVPKTTFNNSFFLFELCSACVEWRTSEFLSPTYISPHKLSLFMTYLADYSEKEKVLLANNYNSASLRCLWYLQSSSCAVRTSLTQRFSSLRLLPQTLGIHSYLSDNSTNITHGALVALPLLLPHASPSVDLLAALKQPFDNEVTLRTPVSSRKALHSIHDYLIEHDPEYRQGEYTVLAGETEAVDDELVADFELFLHRKGTKLPYWICVQ